MFGTVEQYKEIDFIYNILRSELPFNLTVLDFNKTLTYLQLNQFEILN